MCKNESLQQKANKTAIFHTSLSLVAIVFLIFSYLHQETNDFVYRAICNETNDNSNGLTKTRPSLREKYISMFNNGCKIGIIISLLIPLILIIDLSLNLLLLNGVRNRSNVHFVHWLVGQAIRILSCVTFICVIMTLYVFDTWSHREGTADNDLKKIDTFSSNGQDM